MLDSMMSTHEVLVDEPDLVDLNLVDPNPYVPGPDPEKPDVPGVIRQEAPPVDLPDEALLPPVDANNVPITEAGAPTPIDPDTPIPDARPEPRDRVEVHDIPGTPMPPERPGARSGPPAESHVIEQGDPDQPAEGGVVVEEQEPGEVKPVM